MSNAELSEKVPHDALQAARARLNSRTGNGNGAASETELLERFRDRHADLVERAKRDDPTWLEDAVEDLLGLTVTGAQREICRGIVRNHKLLVITANGLGKSYILAAATIVWILIKYPAVAFATSGTEKKMKRTYCKPIKNLHEHGRFGNNLPGTYKHSPERIEFEENPEHFFEAASPEDAGELEGVHAAYTLSIIEEADKKDVDADVVDAMDSLASNEQDRVVAIANPPEDESNIVHQLDEDDPTWETIRFSSFESHNVQVELGETDGEQIEGLATLWKIKQDWRSFNNREWPGVEAARTSHTNTSLDKRWFRRRLGRMPPAGASANRPFYLAQVKSAYQRQPLSFPSSVSPDGLGMDVARKGGDMNVIAGKFTTASGPEIHILDEWEGQDHTAGEQHVRDTLNLDWTARFPIDADAEGSGLADRVDTFYPRERFSNGENAVQSQKYKNKWSEALALFGKFLQDGGTFAHSDLREEALAAARVIEFEEKWYSSRNAEVYKANSKDDIKDVIERSPDYLDAAIMATWAASDETIPQTGPVEVPSAW